MVLCVIDSGAPTLQLLHGGVAPLLLLLPQLLLCSLAMAAVNAASLGASTGAIPASVTGANPIGPTWPHVCPLAYWTNRGTNTSSHLYFSCRGFQELPK